MNAPDQAITLEAELVPLDSIVPSDTHIQQMRRKRFSDEGILELAASIQSSGVINPILVRVLGEGARAQRDTTAKYELVAGERRWLGARRAGLAHIPCVIRDLDDGAVLEAQLVENLQRDNLNPLEEAEGYAELKQLKGYDAAAIGTLIGKSKSYVYARMKLSALCTEAREALRTGTLDYSKGLLLARFNSEKLQKAALKKLSDYGGPRLSYARAFEMLRDGFMAQLASAPFAYADPSYFRMVKVRRGVEDPEALPACVVCPNNSANDAELQHELGAAHMCTDKPCFEAKVVQFWERKSIDAQKEGRVVLTGEEASAAIADRYTGFNLNYLDLDATHGDESDYPEPEPEPKDDADEDSPEFIAKHAAWEAAVDAWTPPTYRQLLGADVPPTVLATGQKGKLHELVPLKEAQSALKAKGVKFTVPSWMRQRAREDQDSVPNQSAAERTAEMKREEERRQIESAFRVKLFSEINAKCKGPLKRPDLERIADLINNNGYNGPQEAIYPNGIKTEKATEPELTTFIIVSLVSDEADDTYRKPGGLLELAQRFKIDHKKIRAEVVKELKPTSASTGPDETKPAKAPNKKAAKK